MSSTGYRSYKDSGVEWLGLVPAHWVVARLKTGFDVRLGKMLQPDAKSPEDELRPYLRAANIQWNGIDLSDLKSMWFSPQEQEQLQLRSGDLLVSEGGDVGRSAIWRDEHVDCLFQNSVNRVRSRNGNDTRFLYYWLAALKAKGYVDVICNKSTIAHYTAEKVAAVPVPFPPIPEQTAIAVFLDHETDKIDALVEEQKRLIELLKEKRQAVISHAVTKGRDPDAPMKDTGITWLGEVPEHWGVVPLKHLTAPGRDIMYGIVLPGPNVEGGVPIVKGGDVRPHKLKVELLNRTTAEIERPFARARLLPNDIVYSIRGTIGDAELVPEELRDANITQDVARIAPREGLNNAWLLYALKSHEIFAQLEVKSLGAAVRGINIFDLKRARIPVPPREEQDAIADYLFEKTRELEQLLSTAQSSINLLQERRAALISAAVTGKIDVRGQSTSTVVTPDFRRSRKLVAAKIVEDLSGQKTFGRVKLQKLLYLAEAHGGIHELRGHYVREAAGPLDRDMVREVETGLQVSGHVVVEQPEGRGTAVNYQLRGTRGVFQAELETLLGDRISALSELIETVGTLDTRGAEAVATLYAVWNDALASGTVPSDDEIIREVLNEWHPKKAETFTVVDLKHWLAWMRRSGLKPKGNAPVTSTGRLFV